MLNPDEFEKFMHELYEKFHMHDLKQQIDCNDIAI